MPISITKRPFDVSFSGNPIHYELTSALAATDASIYFEIRLMFAAIGAGTFEAITTLPYQPVNGVAQINVQDLLNAQLEYQMPDFPADQTTIQPTTKHTGLFYLAFREITPTDLNPAFDVSEFAFQRVVLKGGLNYFTWRGNNFWVNYFATQKPFLTWQKNGRLAAYSERMFLLWFNKNTTDITSVVQRIKITYTDNTTHTVDTPFPDGDQYMCFYLPTGAAQLDLNSYTPLKTIHFWEISVIDTTGAGTALSETFKYYQDNRVDYNGKSLHYRNSLGGLDSVMVKGVIDENLEYQSQEQDRPFQPNYFEPNVITPQRVTIGNQEIQTFRGDVGYLEREEQDRLRDMHVIRDVYVENRGKWWPVTVVTKSFKLRSSRDFMWSMPIEWQLAYDGADFYTPGTVDLGDGVLTENVCLATLLAITIVLDTSGVNGVATIMATESDPQNASTQFRYRILDGVIVVNNWTVANYSDLPLVKVLPKGKIYSLDLQSICTGGVLGNRITKFINLASTEDSGPENSFLRNDTDSGDYFSVMLNGSTVAGGLYTSYGSSGAVNFFSVPDASDATVVLDLGGIPAMLVALVSDGVLYEGSYDTTSGLVVTFEHVNILNGLEIYIS